MILVPWSYGGTEYSCKEKVREWRRDHAGDVDFLDLMNAGELNDFVHRVFDEIAFQFGTCLSYQKRVKKLIGLPKEEHPDNAIEWITPSDFKVVQRVHKTRKKPLRGKVFKSYEEGTGWLAAKLPRDEIDWRAMKTKAPPNLVHSYDATLVHWMLSGNYFIADERTNYHSMVVDPLITVHDSFSSLPIHSEFLLFLLKAYFERIYEAHDPLADFEEDITKIKVTKRKREYKLMLTNNPGAEVFS
jgi:DNA-directed RNA polymerase